MDTELLDEVLTKALDGAEITGALHDLAGYTDERFTALRQELADHIRQAWAFFEDLVSDEIVSYLAEQAQYLAALETHVPYTEVTAAAEQLRKARAEAEVAIATSAANINELLRERRELLDRHEIARAAERARREAIEADAGSTPTRRPWRPRWLGFTDKDDDPEARMRREAEDIQERLALAQRGHQQLSSELAERIGAARYAELVADREHRTAVETALATHPELAALHADMNIARDVLQQALIEKAVLPVCRPWITGKRHADQRHLYRLEFDTSDTSGLRQMMAPKHEVPTVAFERLAGLMNQLGGGAIGISGSRGSGKSTLIGSAGRGTGWTVNGRGVRGVVVPAPVEYLPREFLLHLFATLCRTIAPGADEEEEQGARKEPVSRAFMIAIGASILVAGAVLVAAALSAVTSTAGTVANLSLGAALLLMMASPMRRSIDPFSVALLGFVLSGVATLQTHALVTEPILSYTTTVGLAALAAASVFSPRTHWQLAELAGVGVSAALVLVSLFSVGAVSQARLLGCVFFVLALGLSALLPLTRTIPMVRACMYRARGAAVTIGVGLIVAGAWKAGLDPRMAWGCLLIAAGSGLAPMPRDITAPKPAPVRHTNPRILRSQDELRKIQFQQTTTHGWNETVKLGAVAQSPISVERARSGGTSLQRVSLTYPEIVARFHGYVRFLVQEHALVIGIDELDKLEPEAAHRFMNGVKAIFDGAIPGCYYLVSISEEALAGFEQRGMPTRDVFDTAFDAMLHVDHLTVDGTLAMLGKRLIDLPRGVGALCHALAGGLPRDVIRAIRAVVAARETYGTQRLPELAELVCQQELNSRLHGLRTSLRDVPDWQDAADLTDWAGNLSLTDVTTANKVPDGLLKPSPDGTQRAAQRQLQLHACSYYHLATIVRFFATADEEALHRAEHQSGVAGIEHLAKARNEIGTNWALAWRGISAYRTAWKLDPLLPDPASWPPTS